MSMVLQWRFRLKSAAFRTLAGTPRYDQVSFISFGSQVTTLFSK